MWYWRWTPFDGVLLWTLGRRQRRTLGLAKSGVPQSCLHPSLNEVGEAVGNLLVHKTETIGNPSNNERKGRCGRVSK